MDIAQLEFTFPHHFRVVLKFYFWMFSYPFFYTDTSAQIVKKTLSLKKFMLLIHKIICFTLQCIIILFGIVSMSQLTFIDLRKNPTQIFQIVEYTLACITTIYMTYIYHTKWKVLNELAFDLPTESMKLHKRAIFLVILLIYPIADHLIEAVNVLQRLIQMSEAGRDSQLYQLLALFYIKPEVGFLQPGAVKLESWERTTAYVIIAVGRYNSFVSMVLPRLVLCGGLAVREINAKLLQQMNVPEDIFEVKKMILGKVQDVLQPMITLYVLSAYSSISKNIVQMGEYSPIAMWRHVVRSIMTCVIILASASATSLTRKLMKKMLLNEAKFQTRENFMSSCLGPSDVSQLIDLSTFGVSGIIGTVSFGSLGLAIGVATQLAVIMLQFLEVEKT